MMPAIQPHQPRIIIYYQTHHDSQGKHVSILPLVTDTHTKITHLILAAIHLNEDPCQITLNDHGPHHPRFQTLWAELRVLQASGVKVMVMLGGAAPGTYARLSSDDAIFEKYYVPLRDLIRQRGFDGLDLDVEEQMELGAIIRLIDRLRRDFGPGFIISLAPVAAALLDPQKNLSGFDYEELEVMRGKDIAFYNTQFYCGWGSCKDPVMYSMIIARGWPAEKVVVGLVTNPDNGNGFVPWEHLAPVLAHMRSQHLRFGGVMGWEYFNSLPGGRERPWEWAKWMTAVLGGSAQPRTPPHSSEAFSHDSSAGNVLENKTGVLVDGDTDDDSGDLVPVPETFEYFSDGTEGDSKA